jgi:hypothetical protein
MVADAVRKLPQQRTPLEQLAQQDADWPMAHCALQLLPSRQRALVSALAARS